MTIIDNARQLQSENSSPEFRTNSRGVPDHRCRANVEELFKYLDVKIRRNDFTGDNELNQKLIDDDAVIWLVDEAHKLELRVTQEFMWERIKATAIANRYHPIKQRLDKLRWDGVKRLDTWLITYLGAEDTAYVRAVGALTLIAAIRRIRRPGAKFDTMLILEGEQGTGKSQLLRALAMKPKWFTDSVSLSHDPKQMIEQTRGKWIVEVAELQGFKRADIDHVKASLSRQEDRARGAYERSTKEVKRQFVMIGTANVEDGEAFYLKDPTGNRRFWPVLTGKIRLDDFCDDVEQLWAEAAKRESIGDDISLPKRLWDAARLEQEKRKEQDPWVFILEKQLKHRSTPVAMAELLEIVGKRAGQAQHHDTLRVGRSMSELGGWERKRGTKRGEKRAWHYVPVDRDT